MPSIEDEAPVDGFNVELYEDGSVGLVLSNRYGGVDRFTFPAEDAGTIGAALVAASNGNL
jgi:hypothetical protein